MLIMRMVWWNFVLVLAAAVVLASPPGARAESCTTESSMTAAQRNVYAQASRTLATEILAGNSAAVRANTVAAVASQFGPIAGSIEQVSPLIQKATLTIDDLYNLNAQDLKAGSSQAQFFCAVPNSTLLVTVTIPGLPAGNYALAVLHATGVAQPQQVTLLLQNDPAGSAAWKLAGLFIRPMTQAGHDGVWYWKKARGFAANKQNWDAYFYYQVAAFLLNPADFLSSPNLEKLLKEQQQVTPGTLPTNAPMAIKVAGRNLEVTGLHTDTFGGALDLVVDYKAQGVSDPVSTRAQIVALMKGLLSEHPELREGFHGLWVYAHYDNGQSFAIELPMNQIE